MIAAFGMVAFVLSCRVRSWLSGAGVLLVSVLASYSAAVLVNALRITVAMWLAAHPYRIQGMNAAQIIGSQGSSSTSAASFCSTSWSRARWRGCESRGEWRDECHGTGDCPVVPACSDAVALYYAVAIAVPVANGAAGNGTGFVEHAAFVLVLPLVLVVLAGVGHSLLGATIGPGGILRRCVQHRHGPSPAP